MKSNDKIIKEFEDRRNLSFEEGLGLMKKQHITENAENDIMEVDNIFE